VVICLATIEALSRVQIDCLSEDLLTSRSPLDLAKWLEQPPIDS
jgi:hypothetical protein